jgi:N-acetylglutamate synthase-like GNAT family acetyltransferase
MIIRRAVPEDISEIYKLLIDMYNRVEVPASPVSSHKLMNVINTAIHKGIVLIAEVEGKIIGSLGGMTNSDWWSEEKHLGDLWFYVYPDKRNSRAAIKLVKTFINIGKEINMKIKLGHFYSGDMERKDKFFDRLGFIKTGSLYTEV